MSAYDELRYPGRFYPQASIERMATLATLYGLAPPSVQGSRWLTPFPKANSSAWISPKYPWGAPKMLPRSLA
jgi:hypothetical protein